MRKAVYLNDIPVAVRIKTRRDGRTLDLTLEGGRKVSVDMSGMMARPDDPFSALQEPEFFASAKLTAGGAGVGFGEDGDLAVGVDTLVCMADDQRPFLGRDLAEWRRRMDISAAEAGDMLGYSARHIRNLEKAEAPLPLRAAIAVRAMDADHTLFLAHYRPAKLRRPARSAAEVQAWLKTLKEKTQTGAAAKAKANGKVNGKVKTNGKANGKTKPAAKPAPKRRSGGAQNLNARTAAA